jgi:lipopolysaccharide/colanic/teichoic acid biosynthesis glycosyltransferase
MSLVGPRPERPEIVRQLTWQIPDYAQRMRVRPGVTGLARVNLPADVTVDCVRRKLKVDLVYVQRATVWLDLRILLCTALRFCGMPGPGATRIMRIDHRV